MADSQESADAYEYQKAHLSDNKKAEIIAPTVIFLAIAYTAVFLRYKSRRIARITLEADDWCIGLALITTTCFIIVYYLGMKYGMGRHEILITDPKAWVITIVSTQVLYSISICTIKLSILFLYDRIFGIPKPMFRHILRAMGGFVIAYSVAGTLGTILQCVPLSDLWKPPSNGPPVCIDFGTLVITTGVLNIVTDITILSLPIPLVWGLQVSKPRRWQLVTVFSLGGLVCVISIIRLFFLRVGMWDASYDDVRGTTLSAIECCVGILSACLPTYRPLWRKYGCARTKRTAIANETHPSDLKMLNCAIGGSLRGKGTSTPRTVADGRSEGSCATCQVPN
ncbi:hypothetical protein HO173_004491 [Letharia columbiana]|uniref:Rhodopsin domain-containing protein n=1 Tax=Letharia columbiana TaxID=112416 RepID=A0A8H6L6R7_9LECA|nr:uncharacterized protein HO173_004491 [Letharia columbiana]KAF6237601.1 hypothetical protein HO173_004491 [Letharia columbiana]